MGLPVITVLIRPGYWSISKCYHDHHPIVRKCSIFVKWVFEGTFHPAKSQYKMALCDVTSMLTF